MKDKKASAGGVLEQTFSITELAEILGRDRKTVAAIVRTLEPAPGSSQTRKNYTVRTLLRALSNQQELEISRMTPAERRAHWQADNERLRFEEKSRGLIPVEECRDVYARMVKATAMTLETLPDLLERDCALSPQATGYVQKVIDDFRDYLYDEVNRDAFSLENEECEGENEDGEF